MSRLFLSSLAACFLAAAVYAHAQVEPLVPPAVSAPELIEADYRVKASFFALPLKAKITIRKLEQHNYSAEILLKSPFFKVDQKESARIQQCSVELLSLTSQGSRIGSDDWNETVEVSWPTRRVTYTYDEGKQKSYRARYAPTGFTSFFAHQYTSLFQEHKNKTLIYTQATQGWETGYEYKGIEPALAHSFFKQAVAAERFITPREEMEEQDMPTVWYATEHLASIPLKMSMKLGMFRVEVNLKEVSASTEQIQAFFSDWGC